MAQNQNGPRKEITKGPIEVSRIYNSGEFQKKDTLTAELKQQVTTVTSYPSARVSNNMQANIFDEKADFGFAEQTFPNVETRVAWLNVPTNATEAVIKDRLSKLAGAELYRVLSYEPILTEDQEYAISQGLRTLDDYATKQALRAPEGTENAGKLILHNGHVQYRRVFFMDKPQADMDKRDAAKVYVPDALKAELNDAVVLQGQTI